MTPRNLDDLRTWSEVLVDFDGHLHDEAKDCRHRPGDACRVCCPCDRVHDVEPSTVASVEVGAVRDAAELGDVAVDEFSPLLALVCAASALAVVSGVGYAAIRACIWVGGLR